MRRWQLLDCFEFCLFAVSMRRATGLAVSRESRVEAGLQPKALAGRGLEAVTAATGAAVGG